MAASGMYPAPVSAPRVVALPQQKKILEDVLECIIQLKSEFFENQQPISDDNLTLQRLCAKLEHLIQMGMREKTSLLGRKKDYWDYFCDCLGSAKGSNDGIRYVKNLRENKTSLGRGRAFIRFCLVHQRLADAMQQCLGHEKTSLWFLPSSVLCNQKNSTSLISALYDLNSMHFDLSPRGYDLDSDWPSFSNRKTTPGGSWNVPISRRSSITSMDTISQASLCLATSPDVEKLHKDLEAAHSARFNAQEQIGALHKEKEEISQSAWESQGKVTALQEQLSHSESQHASLQERYRNLDVNFVKLKLEKDYLEKLLSDERKNAQEQECRRVQQLQEEEEVWKREMKEEGERRRREIEKLHGDLKTKREEEEEERKKIQMYSDCLTGLMSDLKIQPSSPQEFHSDIGRVQSRIKELQTQVDVVTSEKAVRDGQVSKTLSDHDDVTKKLEQLQQEMATIEEQLTASTKEISSLEAELGVKCHECDSLASRNLLLEKDVEKSQDEIVSLKDLNLELKDKEMTLKELNKTMKGKILSTHSQNLTREEKIEMEKYLNDIFERDEQVLGLKQQMAAVEREIKNYGKCNGDVKKGSVEKATEWMSKFKADLEVVLTEREEKLRMALSELKATESKSGRFEKEVEVLAHGGQVLNEKLSLCEARVEFVSGKLKEEEAKVVEVLARNEELIGRMKEEGEVRERIEEERNELKSRVEELNSMAELVSGEKEELKKYVEEEEVKRRDLERNLNLIRDEVEERKKELMEERDRIAAMRSDLNGHNESKGETLDQVSMLESLIEEMRREKEGMTSLLEKERNEWKNKLEEVKREKMSLVSDIEGLKGQVREDEGNAKSLTSEMEKASFEIFKGLNTEVLEALRRCLETSSVERDVGRLENISLEMILKDDEDFDVVKEKVKANLKTLCDNVEEVCQSRDKMEETTTNQISAVLEEEKTRLLTEVDAALEETHHIKSQLEQTSELLTVSNTSLDTINSEKESLQAKVLAMTEEISQHESEKDELKRVMSVLKSDLERVEDEVQEKLCEKRKLEVRLGETEDELKAVLEEKSTLEKVAEGFCSQSDFSQKVLEESLADSQRALETIKAEKMELEDKCLWLEKEKTRQEEMLVAVRGDGTTHSEEVDSLKQELENVKEHYELEIDTLHSEISSLQFQMSSQYIEEQAELQMSQSGIRTNFNSVEVLEATVKQLEEENDRLRKREEEEEGSQETQHNKFVLEIQSQEEKLQHYERRMREMQLTVDKAVSAKEEMSHSLTHLQLSAKKRVEDRDKELEILRSDNNGMQRQLKKLIKDKDNLWQKTDALVDERKKKASGRWMDSSKVSQCKLCKAEFSLFLRKHHCRLCGNIFCWSCSDNWLDTAHSSKKARVCQTCFDQQNNPDSMASSLLESESDFEDEDGSVSSSSFLHTFNKDGNVQIKEVHPSVIRSIQNDDVDFNETDEGKLLQRSPSQEYIRSVRSLSQCDMEADSTEDSIYNSNLDMRVNIPGGDDGDSAHNNGDDDTDDSVYQVITPAEMAKTMTQYQTKNLPAPPSQPNMTSSMVLSADELETGEVNRQNEVWIKPGRQFAVPVHIGAVGGGATLSWEFTSHPKDIVFSIKFSTADNVGLSDAEEIVAPCKCDAHRQMHCGELTPKRSGVYTLIFDNTYSRMTSKKVHYHLEYRKPRHDRG